MDGHRTACLTFDIDWGHDAVIADTLDLIDKAGVRTTWFITHDTPMITAIAAGGHELGLHPNFNPLLSGDGGTASDVLDRLHQLAPDARSLRSHSLTRSSRLAQLFKQRGLTHESNLFIPPAAGPVPPWRDFTGLIQVPIRWEDDVRLLDPSIGEATEHFHLPVYVMDFHPIHIFLNSLTIDDYETTRMHHRDPKALVGLRRPAGSGGTRDRFRAVLDQMKQRPDKCWSLSNISPRADF